MSRGTETALLDEAHATYAVGEAINMIAIKLMDEHRGDYESARTDATETMSFALRDVVLNWGKK